MLHFDPKLLYYTRVACPPCGPDRAQSFQSLGGQSTFVSETICRLVILDEISMIGTSFLARINARLQEIKGNDQMLFGGLIVLFVGDFYQLRPVLDRSLATKFSVTRPHSVSFICNALIVQRFTHYVLIPHTTGGSCEVSSSPEVCGCGELASQV